MEHFLGVAREKGLSDNEIDEKKIETFKGAVSLPFEKGDNAKIAVKIIDDRGIESLRVISL